MKNNETGKWEVGEFDDAGGYDCMTAGIAVGPATLDAKHYGQDRFLDCTPEIQSAMIKDAHLIAASPDLLAALKTFLDAYISLANSGAVENWDPETESHVISARVAIAKAEGRS